MTYTRGNFGESVSLGGDALPWPVGVFLLRQGSNYTSAGVRWSYYVDSRNESGRRRVVSSDSSPSFAWRYSEWSPCSSSCGQGTRVSTAVCAAASKAPSKAPVAGRSCPPPRPTSLRETCVLRPCPPRWWLGPWTGCGGGGGHARRRSVICVRDGGREARPLPDTFCLGLERPLAEERCSNETSIPMKEEEGEEDGGEEEEKAASFFRQEDTPDASGPTKPRTGGRGRGEERVEDRREDSIDIIGPPPPPARFSTHLPPTLFPAITQAPLPPPPLIVPPSGRAHANASSSSSNSSSDNWLPGECLCYAQMRFKSCLLSSSSDVINSTFCEESRYEFCEAASGPLVCVKWREGNWSRCTTTTTRRQDGGGNSEEKDGQCFRNEKHAIEGKQVREVVCPLPSWGRCNPGQRPRQARTCRTDCHTWWAGPWDPCSTTCGWGVRTRQVACRHLLTMAPSPSPKEDCAGEAPAPPAAVECRVKECEEEDEEEECLDKVGEETCSRFARVACRRSAFFRERCCRTCATVDFP